MSARISLGSYDVESHSIPIFAAVNKRAKRITLRYDFKNQLANVTIPSKKFLPQAQILVQKNQEWILNCVNNYSQQTVQPNSILTLFGKTYRLLHVQSVAKHVWVTGEDIIVYGHQSHFSSILEGWIKSQALKFFHENSYSLANQLQSPKINRIKLQDRRTAWGSCSGNGNLSYSWRLVFAPLEVALYVCAHEVSHLLEMNHSSKFWDIVSQLCPQFKENRLWLRKNGKGLFTYKF